ncbi:MAG: tyrosine-type recombinase/integrase [Eggerthellaceae bacterium]|nr:tyrosine-type recombinase/integrase [Eggerthellaceae bacterium]
MYDIDDLIDGAKDYLVKEGHSRSSIAHHEAEWKRLKAWFVATGLEAYDHDVETRYFVEAGFLGGRLTKQRQTERGHVERLLSIAETGGLPDREAKTRYSVPPGFAGAYRAYADKLEARGLKHVTRKGYLCVIRNFCMNCGASRPSDLDARSIGAFAEAVSGCAPQTRSSKLYVVRDFLRFLAKVGMCGPEAAAAAPLIPGHKHSTVPSAYTPAEVSPMLEGFPRSLRPKRDRAIVLLASVLGMRVGDIKRLKLSDIDWRAKTVSFVQSKTHVANTLHMPEEVWLAVADYIKSERPDIGDDHIFITACAPYHAMDSSHVFHRMVTRAFADAGVETAGKHHGMHSLRHSAATNMLAGGTPYPTISSVLGHSSVNVTKRYLSIDVESLRPLALEVPTCR